MTSTERCDGTPCLHIVVRQEQWYHLLPRRRVGQQIFEEVIRKAPVGEGGFARLGHWIGLANARLQLWHLLEISVKTNGLKLSLVPFECRAPNVVTNAQNSNLPVLDRFRI